MKHIERYMERYRNRSWVSYLPTALLTVVLCYVLRHLLHGSNGVFIAGGNIWEVADWICMDGAAELDQILAAGNVVNTDYQPEFDREFPVGDTVRVPLPVMGTIRQGLSYSGAPVVNKHTTVTADQVFGMDFDIDSVEEALRLGRSRDYISKKVIRPYMKKIAVEWEQRLLSYCAKNCPNLTGGALGTDPTGFDATSTVARQELVEWAGWNDTENGIFLPPSVMRNLRTNFATAFNPVADIDKAFRTGLYREADGFDFYESMQLLQFTTGTWASPSGLTVKTTSVSGDTQIVLNCTTGDVFNAGDKMQITGRFRVNPYTKQKIGARQLTLNVAATTTGASSSATVPISIGPYGILGPGDPYQNVDSLPTANDVVTMWPGTTFTANTAKTGFLGMAFNREAFMMVGIPLRVPKSAEKASHQRAEVSGIDVRFTETWDANQSRFIYRLDTVGGFGVAFSDSCATIIPCA